MWVMRLMRVKNPFNSQANRKMTSLIYSESLPEPMPAWVCQKSDSRFAKRFAMAGVKGIRESSLFTLRVKKSSLTPLLDSVKRVANRLRFS